MAENTMRVCQYDFSKVAAIEPLRDTSGRVIELMPQAAYANRRGLRLNPHGAGPFCTFTVPQAPHRPGVYLILVDDHIKYVGECIDLAVRFSGQQYGAIHPRNCYQRGQSTNCKVNHKILVATQAKKAVSLWFHETAEYKRVEQELRIALRPCWNHR
jgi:hypothetical protein